MNYACTTFIINYFLILLSKHIRHVFLFAIYNVFLIHFLISENEVEVIFYDNL